MKKFKHVVSIIVLGAMVSLSACSNNPSTNDTVAAKPSQASAVSAESSKNEPDSQEVFKIGILTALTGQNSNGAYPLSGAELAINEINETGGIAGKWKIEYYAEDDENVVANSIALSQKLIAQEGIHALIGAYNSANSIAVGELTQENEIPQMCPASTAASVVEQGYEYIFRIAAPDKIYAESIVDYLIEQGYESAAIIYDSSEFGLSGSTFLLKYAKEIGHEDFFVTTEVYTTGDRDFSTQLTNMKGYHPEVIVPWGWYEEVAPMLQQMKQLDIDSLVCGYGFENDGLSRLAGEYAEGVMAATSFVRLTSDPRAAAFVEKFEQNYNLLATKEAVNGYDAVYAFAKAVEAADSIDGKAVAEQLHKLHFSGIGGEFEFESNGEIQKRAFMTIVEGGLFVLID